MAHIISKYCVQKQDMHYLIPAFMIIGMQIAIFPFLLKIQAKKACNNSSDRTGMLYERKAITNESESINRKNSSPFYKSDQTAGSQRNAYIKQSEN